MKRIKTIGLDIHGVLDYDTDWFFGTLIPKLKEKDIKIHIITGMPFNNIFEEIRIFDEKWYDVFFSITEHLLHYRLNNVPYEQNKYCFDPKDWDVVKANYCAFHHIDLMVDDTYDYKKYFKTNFMHWDVDNPARFEKLIDEINYMWIGNYK